MSPPDRQPAATGGCACGGVRWELAEPPVGAAICHCKRCQRRTGTVESHSALTVPGSLRFTQGEELLRLWDPGDGWKKYFCGRCGSAVYTQNPKDERMISMRMGGFDDDPGVRPGFHQFVTSAAAWSPIPDDGLPRYEERSPLTQGR